MKVRVELIEEAVGGERTAANYTVADLDAKPARLLYDALRGQLQLAGELLAASKGQPDAKK